MKLRSLGQAALVIGVSLFMTAASASAAAIINYTTSGTGSIIGVGFGGGSSTLVFTGNTTSGATVPSIVNLGDFLLTCTSCTTNFTAGAIYAAGQTMTLNVHDTTDAGFGHFIGTLSTGGAVAQGSSPLIMSWGGFVIDSGSFGSTTFAAFSPTPIANNTSGTPFGDTTVQGQILSPASAIPEPATLSMMGIGLLGLGLIARRRKK